MDIDYKLAKTVLSTYYGDFEFYCFCWGPHEEENILCLRKAEHPDMPLVRVQSACYTAEIFRSRDCDCHEQLVSSLNMITTQGGLLIYMLCDGRGAGLYNKILGLELTRTRGLDTADAYLTLGIELDPRLYAKAAQVISHFGIEAVSLLTNNPRKCHGLEAQGLRVKRIPLEIPATSSSRQYLKAKAHKLGHQLTQFDADP